MNLRKMNSKIKVAIAEDKQHLRDSLKQNLGFYNEVEVVFTAVNGQDIVNKTEAFQPDVILMDIEMPLLNGIEATEVLKTKYPNVHIMMLTVFDDDKRIMEAILAGANGYMLKEEHPGKIVDSIKSLMEGGAPLSASIAIKTLNLLKQTASNRTTPQEDFGISDREMQVLTRMADGQTYQQVSDDLAISPKTVRNHIQNIYKKLHVNSKMEAVNKAREMGWM